MKLLVLLLCLLCERFLIHKVSYQRFFWFADYCNTLKSKVSHIGFFVNPWSLLALIIIPLLVLALIIYLAFYSIAFGLVGLILSIITFFYCLGPENIFYPVAQADTKKEQELVGDYLIATNRQLFSLVFWFIIAGPIGALAYRLITLCRDFSAVHEQANEITELLEWIPTRFTVMFFLLAGNFQRGISLLIRFLFAKPEMNCEMLRDCGIEAIKINDTEEVSMQTAENLVEHAIIIMLVFIAICTLFAWF